MKGGIQQRAIESRRRNLPLKNHNDHVKNKDRPINTLSMKLPQEGRNAARRAPPFTRANRSAAALAGERTAFFR